MDLGKRLQTTNKVTLVYAEYQSFKCKPVHVIQENVELFINIKFPLLFQQC